jgi:hypothetical protein
MYKILLPVILLNAPLISSAQNNSITDGPYVFYKNDSLFVETIINGKLKTEASLLKRNKTTILNVIVPGRPSDLFSVPLKKVMEAEPSEYKPVEKIFVTSDIEGTFESFQKMLLVAGVIDEKFKWTYDKGHLVVCGDLFDRADEVTACLWLLYKLEEEAKAKGGYVHVIMGNHEIMNLSEDLRYVHPKYLEAANLMQKNYMEFYASNTELGRWLRTKNIMERIGNWLFLHGGVSQAVNEQELSLKKINNSVRNLYDKDGFDSLLAQNNATIFFNGNTSPFWYRGYFIEPFASMAQVDSSLKIFDVKKIIVGHTIVDSVHSIYNGKIIAIDVNHHKQNNQALIIEKDCFYRMEADGKKSKIE